jgi:hypothetical protein
MRIIYRYGQSAMATDAVLHVLAMIEARMSCRGSIRFVGTCRFIGTCSAVIAAGLAASAASTNQSLYAPASCCEMQRAGFPLEQSCLAKSTNPRAYTGYYVGGSQKSNCNCRCRNEGTWGWDYVGKCKWMTPLVRLNFAHPPRFQGGPGSYAPDGPRPCEKGHED